MQHAFDHNKFIGYVCEVTPQYIKVQLPSAKLLHSFYLNGQIYYGGTVGCYVTVEGQEYGFLGHLYEMNLPQGERQEITDKDIHYEDSTFHPIAKVEILGAFSIYQPTIITKTVSLSPNIGAKVYSCSNEQMTSYISSFGIKSDEDKSVYPIAKIGVLTTNNAPCCISLNSLFGRHCAVLGTTGGGKSWTVAKLIELVSKNTNNKCILIDATGEYSSLDNETIDSIKLGTGEYVFNYRNLTIDDIFYLLRPSAKVQAPKLMEAIRSLKMIQIDSKDELNIYYSTNPQTQQIEKFNLQKALKDKRKYQTFYYQHLGLIEDNHCNFEFQYLAHQITNECIWDTQQGNTNTWGGRAEVDVANCVSLISRINNIINTSEYNNIFAFKKNTDIQQKDIRTVIDTHLQKSNGKPILRIDFSEVSFDYQVREILVNAIGKYLLNRARSKDFISSPVIVFIDEAHQFLNKSISDEYFTAKPLDAFEQISKEARKYGLFLCIATQMPRDIPLGTLSQMGTFIVHRLINEQDKKAVESAASAANRNCLSYLPVLGEGEALLVGVDFPMPITLKIEEPINKPNSGTPKLKRKE